MDRIHTVCLIGSKVIKDEEIKGAVKVSFFQILSVSLSHILLFSLSYILLFSPITCCFFPFSILGTQARGWTLLTFGSATEALASPNNNTNSGVIYVLDDFEGSDFQALHKSDRSVNRNERKNIFGPGIMKHHLDEIERMMEEKCPRSGNLQGVIVSTIGKFYNFKLRGKRICISGVRCKEDTPEWVRFHSLLSHYNNSNSYYCKN